MEGKDDRLELGLELRAYNAALRKRRRAKGWTQIELAKKAGLSPTSITHYERLINAPSPASAQKIAAALGCEASEIFPSWLESRNHCLRITAEKFVDELAMRAIAEGLPRQTHALPPSKEDQRAACWRAVTDRIGSAIHLLRPRERRVIELRFGIAGTEGRPLAVGEVAQVMGVSHERICQIEKEALVRLAKAMALTNSSPA